MDIVFTGSQDGKVKGWVIDRANNTFTSAGEQNFGAPVNCLQMVPNTILVGGTNNNTGQMTFWNLNDNSVNSIPAHQANITSLYCKNQYLISGDATGQI